MIPSNNVLDDLPTELAEELVQVLLENQHVRIERIVSTGQASPAGFWYDQARAEWVLLLTGEAQLLIEGDSEAIHLLPGSHLQIPAHRRHRVEWTSPHEPTVWLAVHFASDQGHSEA